MANVGWFPDPLEQLERVAVEPLPDFDEFLGSWNDLVRKLAENQPGHGWNNNVDSWRREVAMRLEGTDGLAAIARSTKRSDDYRAWVYALAEARDWPATISACDEAVEHISDKTQTKGNFLDGAALASQELGRRDLPKRLERAWRIEPSLVRLRRWLGSATNKTTLKKRVAAAVEACPGKAHRQLAFLYVLGRNMRSAAKLLSGAPGLGWSNSEHPGHLLFPLFFRLLGGTFASAELDTPDGDRRRMETSELDTFGWNRDGPRLRTPSTDEILALAGIDTVNDRTARAAMLTAMRKSAEKRLDGTTGNKRRNHYGHAASLAVACAAADSTGVSSTWLADIRNEYRRYPALQREFDMLMRRR